MKEEINLLPPQAQSLRIRTLYAKRLRSIFTSFVIALIVIGIAYGGAYGVLLWTYQGISQSLAATDTSGEDVSKETKAVNEKIIFAQSRLKENPSWTPHIADVLRVIPADMVVSGIQAESDTQTLMINGTSGSRGSILQLEDTLKTLTWVKSVEAPLQNFASGPNITFRFTIERKDE